MKEVNLNRDPESTQRERDLDNLTGDLEVDLKKRMEQSWKLLFSIDEISKERNFFYNLLLKIEVKFGVLNNVTRGFWTIMMIRI